MYHELLIKTPHREFPAFLQEGFYNGLACSPIHNHSYAEVHLILDGTAVFVIEGKKHEIKSGHMLVIPKKAWHACIRQDEGTLHTAFQIDYDGGKDIAKFEECPIDGQILRRFFDEIRHCAKTNDYTMISAFMALFLCCFHTDERMVAKQVINYGFIIHEFFSNRYNEDVRLLDLANMLHLSPRQTERLVQKHTGQSFGKALVATRVMIANQLIGASDLSLHEIAEYVGYRSYAGFWKAMKSFHTSK